MSLYEDVKFLTERLADTDERKKDPIVDRIVRTLQGMLEAHKDDCERCNLVDRAFPDISGEIVEEKFYDGGRCISTVMTCPKCQGKGGKTKELSPGVFVMQKCDCCNGVGKVRIR